MFSVGSLTTCSSMPSAAAASAGHPRYNLGRRRPTGRLSRRGLDRLRERLNLRPIHLVGPVTFDAGK